jgi:EAL domain-containing protein (putative c-di-GMP-specific phosphodiesterase class I)
MPPLHKPFRIAELQSRLTQVRDRPPAPAGVLELEAALRNNCLELWYQPKVDLKTMRICGAEALIRLRDPVRGVLPPSEFLPPAGDRLYFPLSDFVVKRALADWPAFARTGMVERLAVNVPASVLQRPDFVATIRANLPRHPTFPGLIVEITEDEAIQDPELAREIAVQLKLYDVYVSIDDFGSGYSSLARLKELPFAEIKLDRRFVAGCSGDESKRGMCKAVIELARRFGLTSVAEGVERDADLMVLKEIGYSVGQGYLLGKPMPRDDLLRRLASRG